jgi:virginiamycin B lyase
MAFPFVARAREVVKNLFAVASLSACLCAQGQTVQEYTIGIGGKWEYDGIAEGTDGNLWFSERTVNSIGTRKADGTFATVSLSGITNPTRVVRGPDNRIWFTADRIVAAINYSDHSIAQFPLTSTCQVNSNVASDSTALWFSELCMDSSSTDHDELVKLTPAGLMTKYTVGAGPSHYVYSVVNGPDNNIWFTEPFGNAVGRLNKTTMAITEFAVPTADSQPYNITVGPDNALWFFETNGSKISRIDTSGVIQEFPWPGGLAFSVIRGPDNNLWTVAGDMEVRRTAVGPTGIVSTAIAGKRHNIGVSYLTIGADHNLWFTEQAGIALGVIRMDGIFVDDFQGNPSP